jgi:16S rRNA (cytosine1402-N4)-methyltransferase
MNFNHVPVLLHQAISGLAIQKDRWYADLTLGGGGYTLEILKQQAKVLSFDVDQAAIEAATARIQNELPQSESRYRLVHENYRQLRTVVEANQLQLAGIVADLGISSYQLDTPERGFSFRFPEAQLDLRMDQSQGMTAAALLQSISEEELYEIIATYGEEERARTIARALVGARKIEPIQTTGDVLKVIDSIGKGQTEAMAARVFQALRMVVNDETGALKQMLLDAEAVLEPGGRLVVVSFHSLEDRLVKLAMRRPAWKIVTKQPIRPDSQEQQANRRSRSAKLRIAEKCA